MYNIQASIPSIITIDNKQNISGLVGEVISSCYYLSIKDYQQFNTSINGIIDTLNKINYYHNNINFTNINDLKNDIDTLISSSFISITQLNGHLISETQQRNIKVLKQFTINDQKYISNDKNNGNIVLKDHFISGKPQQFVQSFNNKTGNVTGAIEQIRINGKVQEMINGVVTLKGLRNKDRYVIKINNETDNIFIMNSIKIGDDDIIIANNNNQGNIVINTNNFIINSNNILNSTIKLSNVDETDNKTAINKQYLKTYINENDLIKIFDITNSNIIDNLPSPNYYPLHFYDNDGNLVNVIWTIDLETHIITLDRTFTGKYSVMRVENE